MDKNNCGDVDKRNGKIFISNSIYDNQMLKQTYRIQPLSLNTCVIFLNNPLSDFEREFLKKYRKCIKKVNHDNNKMIIIIIAEIKINQMKSLVNKFYYLAITISTR